MLSHTLLGSCALMDIRTSQAMHHLKTLWTPCSSHLACSRADSILTWLLFLRSRPSSHILVWKVPELVEAHFPFGSGAVWLQTAAFGSGAVDPWPAISGRPEHNFAGDTGVTVWKYCVGSQTVNMRSGNRSICEMMMTWSPCR